MNKKGILVPEVNSILEQQVSGELSAIEGNIISVEGGRKVKSIFVTSCYTGEGKTICAISTAYALAAKSDSKVLLVDGNFNSPGIHELFGLDIGPGLSDFLVSSSGRDEIVHEDDYDNIKKITKRFPTSHDILHLPIIELWGNGQTVTGRRHSWKWRMSRNKPEITHGINKGARLTDEKSGKVYAKEGMSDGCEYVNAMSYEMLPHTGFYNNQIEMMRVHAPEQYAAGMNGVFSHPQMPCVFHYSWCSLENKVKNFRDKWDKQWNALYLTENVVRFPGIKTDEQVKELAAKLYKEGGEESDNIKYKFPLSRTSPKIMEEWLSNVPLNFDK